MLPKIVSEVNLAIKKTRTERKKQGRIQKRKIVQHINKQLKENITLTVLAESESIQAYQRKRLAMSFENPTTPKRIKLHSPAEGNHTWDHEAASTLISSHPVEEKINWSRSAKTLNIPGKNSGQVLKEYAIKQGFDILVLEQKASETKIRTRRNLKKLPGGEISTPSLPPPDFLAAEKKEMIKSGKLSLGEPCSPHTVIKTIVTSDGDVLTEEHRIIGRKLSLLKIRKKLLTRHSKYMRLMTNEQVKQLTRDDMLCLLKIAHCYASPSATLTELQNQIISLQRKRSLVFWHDHSTVLQQGYILFAVKVVYDTGVFFTDKEWRDKGNETTRNIQEVVEQPVIQMIAPSTSALFDQLALVADRLECLTELSEEINDSNDTPITDKARFFCGDKPAQQFERGTQVGGTYKCGSCGCKDTLLQDLPHALQCPPRSLEELQSLVTTGQFGKQPGKLKPFDKLLLSDLKVELTTRGIDTSNLQKPQMQERLKDELKGAQRVPSLLVTNPTQSLKNVNLANYEILDCEPLHDIKGHLTNLIQEIPYLLSPTNKELVLRIIQSTIKETSSGVHLRVAVIKIHLKLLNLKDVDDDIKLLLTTIVKISELLYLPEIQRNPKTVLQLYNVTWLHHELCCKLIPTPKTQSREKFYGIYLHDLVVHSPLQYQMVSLRSTNAESTERLFSQIKHISHRATNRKPENVLTTILLSLQAKEETGTSTTMSSIHQQGTMVTEVARKLPPYSGTCVAKSFLKDRMSSWQAHLSRISAYLKLGDGVWWENQGDSYQFHDSDNHPPTQIQGPALNHFRSTNISCIWRENLAIWEEIIEQNVSLPIPFIRVFKDGQYTGRRYYNTENEEAISSDQITTEEAPPITLNPQDNESPGSHLFVHPLETPNPCESGSLSTPQGQTRSQLPINLLGEFNSCECSSPSDIAVNCELNCQYDEQTQTTYQSKAAIQIEKAIGENSVLLEFDENRLQLKRKALQKKKPSTQEKTKYNALLAKLHIFITSTKHKMKKEIEDIESSHYAAQGTLPSNNAEYDQLLKKLDYVRKLLGLWHKFDI